MGRVRNKIAETTRNIHLDLHSDPVLRCLTDTDVKLPQYLRALGVFHAFYHHVEMERRRLSAWDNLALDRECQALKADLPTEPLLPAIPCFADETEMLGGVYVALGASFGRKQFRDNVTRVLPTAPREFISLRTSKSVWMDVISALEEAGAEAADVSKIGSGATKCFRLMKTLAAKSVAARNDPVHSGGQV